MSSFAPGPIPMINNGSHGLLVRDEYTEHGTKCMRDENAEGCFLKPAVRQRLIDLYQDNVLAAQIEYGDAVGDLRLDLKMEKPEDAPILISLAFQGAESLLGTSLTKIFKKLVSAPLSQLDALDIMSGKRDEQSKFMGLVRSSDPSGLVKMGLAQGRSAALGSFGGGQTEETTASLDYLSSLADSSSAIAFAAQRTQPLANASDADLYVLAHAWSAAAGNTRAGFRTAIAEKLGRWNTSGASKVGRKKVDEPTQGNVKITRDTKLVWRASMDPEVPGELWLYKRDYNALASITQKTMDDPSADIGDFYARDATYVEWKLVEPEFTQEAIAANQAAWGKPYETEFRFNNHAQMMTPKGAAK